MRQDFLALLADARLPSDARVMAMLILEMGDGWHELSHEQFAAILDGPSSETIRRHLRKLENAGWIESKTNTGRRAPQYRFRPWDEAGPFQGVRNVLLASLPESLPHTDEGHSDSAPHHGGAEDFFPPHGRGAEAVSPTPTRGKAPPSSISPVPPPPPERAHAREGHVTEEAEEAIERASETLNGCRGSLRDYLRQRVEPRHQVGYVQRVVTSLEGGDEWMWKDRRMQTLTEGRTKVLAAAFNELLAGDEVGQYFADPPGGFGNLRSKVRYLVASALGVENDAKRNTGRTESSSGSKPNAGASTPRVHVEG